ncbi:MAG: hypothetical protein ACK5XN_21800 [Bacteroidota bacterium]
MSDNKSIDRAVSAVWVHDDRAVEWMALGWFAAYRNNLRSDEDSKRAAIDASIGESMTTESDMDLVSQGYDLAIEYSQWLADKGNSMFLAMASTMKSSMQDVDGLDRETAEFLATIDLYSRAMILKSMQ